MQRTTIVFSVFIVRIAVAMAVFARLVPESHW